MAAEGLNYTLDSILSKDDYLILSPIVLELMIRNHFQSLGHYELHSDMINSTTTAFPFRLRPIF